MEIRQPLTIDLAQAMPMMPVSAVQGDGSTRILSVTLLENGAPWQIPEAAVVDVAFRKPDGTKGIYSRLPDGSSATSRNGNVLSATMAPQMLTCPGTVLATFVFRVDGGKTLAAFPFTVTVEASPAAGAEISEDYFNPTNLSDLRAEIAAVGAYAKQTGNPHNFLDNSDFRNPVNQRGKTGSNTAGEYVIDRWFVGDIWTPGACAFSQYDGSIAFREGLFQRISVAKSEIVGKTYTLALKSTDGTIRVFPIALPANMVSGESYFAASSHNVTGVLRYFDGIGLEVRFEASAAISCLWAALYEGEYTAETLPEYHPKGYGVELAECQRYYRILRNAYIPIFLYSATAACATLFGFNMRITPTVNILKYSEVRFADGTIGIVSGIISADNQNDGTVKLLVNDITNANSQRSGFLYDWILELSADL